MMKKIVLLFLVAVATLPLQSAVIKPVKVTGSSFVTFNVKREQHNPELTADGKIGNHNSYWASNFKDKIKPPHTITFDFGKKVTFSAVKLDMMERYNFSVLLNNFKLEYWNGKAWNTLLEKKLYAAKFFMDMRSKNPAIRYGAKVPDAHPVFTFAPVSGSKLRLVIYDSIARLDEMTVYDKAPAAKKATVAVVPPRTDDPVKRYSFAKSVTAPEFMAARVQSEGEIYYADRGTSQAQPGSRLPSSDEVRRFFAAGLKRAFLSIPVEKPGYYHLFLMAGDTFMPSCGTKMEINGKKVELTAEPAGNFPWKTVTVKAEKEIKITLLPPWIINAVIAAPVSEQRAFDAAVTKTVMGKLFPLCKHDPQPTHTEKPQFDSSDKKRGYIAFMPSIQQRVYAHTTPKQEQRKSEISLSIAPDSMKAASVAFYALKDIPEFKLEYQGQLKCTLHPIRNWVQRTGHKAGTRNYAVVPELLDDNEPKFIVQGSTLQYYLLFDIPEDTKPGIYSGKVTLSGNNIAKQTIPVRVNVRNIKLEKLDNAQYTAMYMGDSKRIFLKPGDDKDRAFDRVKLADMRKHNMNSILFPMSCQSFPGKAAFEKHYLEVNAELDKAGYPRLPMAWHCQSFSLQDVKDIQAIVKRTGLREILYYPVDEPHFGKRHIAEKMYPLVKQVPGTHTYSTVSQQDVDSFGKYLDYRTYMITGFAKFEADRLREECKRDGKHFWWYSNAAREYPAANRFKAGAFAYRCGSTGQLYWAYDNAESDAWNDFDDRGNDHLAVYTMGGKLYSTLQWEAIREGLDDLRYIYALEKKIAANPDSTAAKEGRILLEKIKADTVIDLMAYKKKFGLDYDIHHYCFWEPEKFDLYREQIADAIEKFN